MEMESSTGSIFLCLLVKEPKKECSLQDFSEILEPYGTNLENSSQVQNWSQIGGTFLGITRDTTILATKMRFPNPSQLPR